jgi:diacylglycerol O-acyltransferase
MGRHRMSAGDTAWLHMDRSVNKLIVTSVMWFDEPLDWTTVRKLLDERLIARYPRFSQRIVDHGFTAWWEDVDDFDIGNHITRAALPSPGGMAELQAYVSEVASTPLRSDLPPWEAHFVDNFRGTGTAVVTRIHHCVADGIALARVLLSLTDDPTTAAQARVTDAAPHDMLGPAVVVHAVRAAAGEAIHPARVIDHARDVAAAGRAVARLFGLPPDAHTCLRGEVGTSKAVTWTEPFDLAHAKAAAHAADVTVNDIALCAIAGALRNHLARHDGHAPDVRMILPVNLRPLQQPLPRDLGNEFGLVFLRLPVSVDDPLERLAEVHRRTTALKTSAEPVMSYRILELTGQTPYPAEQVVVELFTAKASGVVTNVPGPRTPVFLAGRRLRGMIAWPPESGGLGLGVSIISYDGELVIGLLTDERVLPDSQHLLADIAHEFVRLVHDLPTIYAAAGN